MDKKITVETNAIYAATNDHFKELCGKVGVNPTSRQASKYRNKKGKVYKTVNNIEM